MEKAQQKLDFFDGLPPGKTGGSSYAGIALCSSRDT